MNTTEQGDCEKVALLSFVRSINLHSETGWSTQNVVAWPVHRGVGGPHRAWWHGRSAESVVAWPVHPQCVWWRGRSAECGGVAGLSAERVVAWPVRRMCGGVAGPSAECVVTWPVHRWYGGEFNFAFPQQYYYRQRQRHFHWLTDVMAMPLYGCP